MKDACACVSVCLKRNTPVIFIVIHIKIFFFNFFFFNLIVDGKLTKVHGNEIAYILPLHKVIHLFLRTSNKYK